MAEVAAWVATALLVWIYLLYPLLAAAWARVRTFRPVPAEDRLPALVSVGLAVHDGAADIDRRLTDILAQAVPFPIEIIVASDGSTDATSTIVAERQGSESRLRLLELPRVGQAAAQAAIFREASGDIVVLTDVETQFEPGCLAALVEPLGDSRIGCVTGVLGWYDEGTLTASHEGLYWRYEQRVRAWESDAGWLTAATGALLAARRSLLRPVPPHASLDQMLPLLARQQGLSVVVNPLARGIDRPTAGRAEQFASRTRIATQGIEANLRMTLRILPWRVPGSFLAIWSHKILRWATPYLAGVLLAASSLAYLDGRGVIYLVPLGSAITLGLLAVAGYLGSGSGRWLRLTDFALSVVAVNAAFAIGWVNVLLRRRVTNWQSAAQVSIAERPPGTVG